MPDKDGPLKVAATDYMLENNKAGFVKALLYLAIDNNYPISTRFLLTVDESIASPARVDATVCSMDYIGGAISGQTRMLLLLLKNHPSGPSPLDARGDCPLHRASRKGHLAVVKVLVEQKAIMSSPNKKGDTPLQIACAAKAIDVVKYLLDQGADVNQTNKNNGDTALHVACNIGDLGLERL